VASIFFRCVPFLLLLLAGACGGSGARPPVPPEPDPPFVPPEQEDVRLDTTPVGSALSVFPRIVAGGGDLLYVVWYDRRNGFTDVYFSRSLDGGAEWSASEKRLDTDPPGAASSNVPQIAADGDRVYVAWEDTRSGLSEVRFNRSVDAGATWLAADVRLDAATPDGSSFRVDVAASGGRVWVVWQDDQAGEEDIYLNLSEDAGTTWLPAPLRLDTDLAGSGASTLPQIVSVGDVVLVVWQDTRDGAADIRLNRSADGGRTWLAADVRLDTDVAGTPRPWARTSPSSEASPSSSGRTNAPGSTRSGDVDRRMAGWGGGARTSPSTATPRARGTPAGLSSGSWLRTSSWRGRTSAPGFRTSTRTARSTGARRGSTWT